jgi:hypothetical protein
VPPLSHVLDEGLERGRRLAALRVVADVTGERHAEPLNDADQRFPHPRASRTQPSSDMVGPAVNRQLIAPATMVTIAPSS